MKVAKAEVETELLVLLDGAKHYEVMIGVEANGDRVIAAVGPFHPEFSQLFSGLVVKLSKKYNETYKPVSLSPVWFEKYKAYNGFVGADTPDVTKEHWIAVTIENERFIEYGDGDGLNTIANISDLYAGRPDQIAAMLAAPQMLAVLEDVGRWWNSPYNSIDGKLVARIQAIIKEARGC